jgi:hypothetical protein
VFSPDRGLNARRLEVVTAEVATIGTLDKVIKRYADDRSCQEVILFLGRHPQARFSRLAIVHALGGYKLYIEQALNHLANDGVVKRYVKDNLPLYSLSVDR